MRSGRRDLRGGDPVRQQPGLPGDAALTAFQHRRVLVYGVTGAGKSTCAEQLGARTGLPVVLVDERTWQPGWVPVPEEQQRRDFAEITAGDRWVLDSAYGGWLDVVLPRVDLVVGLDYPRWLSFQRLVRRSLLRIVDQRPICNGNTESLRLLLRRDSILVWHFRSFSRKRTRMRTWAATPDAPEVLLFARPRDLEAWLRSLSSGPSRDETCTQPSRVVPDT